MLTSMRKGSRVTWVQRQVSLVLSRSAFFKRDPEVLTDDTIEQRKRNTKTDGPSTTERFQSLEKHSPSKPNKGYSPPLDVEERIERIAKEICGNTLEWRSLKLDDRRVKFKLLTSCIKEFNHDIPNPELSDLNTNEDVINYFNTPVRDKRVYENLASLNLPRNLHIQMEALRFDPDTDTMFGGKTAFPGRPTIITSLRAKKKYKGTNVAEYWPDQDVED